VRQGNQFTLARIKQPLATAHEDLTDLCHYDITVAVVDDDEPYNPHKTLRIGVLTVTFEGYRRNHEGVDFDDMARK